MIGVRIGVIIIFHIVLANSMRLDHHHNNNEVERILKNTHRKCHGVTRLKTLSDFKNNKLTTFKNKLTVIEFADPPGKHIPGRPEFKYVGNMHGNEVVSREILLGLVVHLCNKWRKGDASIMSLLKRTRIHILVSMNPDGWSIATKAPYRARNIVTGRRTAHNIDLNRNFPELNKRTYFHTFSGHGRIDHLLKQKDFKQKRLASETQMVIKWMLPIPFVLSANLHGGALVANYPYDQTIYPGYYVYSKAPDDKEFRRLSHAYADNHALMHNKTQCGRYHFKGGITNGAKWYSLKGGMQDFNYLATNCFELTLEVSCIKYPPASLLPWYHKLNLPPLMALIWESHTGVKGTVFVKSKNKKLRHAVGARITVTNITDGNQVHNEHAVVAGKHGDYYRLLTDGDYKITASLPGMSASKCVTVKNAPRVKDATIANIVIHEGVKAWKDCRPACKSRINKKLLTVLKRLDQETASMQKKENESEKESENVEE